MALEGDVVEELMWKQIMYQVEVVEGEEVRIPPEEDQGNQLNKDILDVLIPLGPVGTLYQP